VTISTRRSMTNTEGVKPVDVFLRLRDEKMSAIISAIEQIVGIYVRYNNRTTLEKLRSHRQKLLFDLKTKSPDFDSSHLIKQLEDEIAVINSGLEKLPNP
jgi:hypothetical protein